MSSNYRDFRNLVETLEEVCRKGNLQGKEFFLFTNNIVLESITASSSSKLEELFYLVVRLHCLSMRFK